MAGKRSRARKATDSTQSDDFSSIQGIGRITQARLHEAGIRTYKQLASLSPAKLATRIIGFSAKQIERQDWIGQARKLVSKKAPFKTSKNETAIPPTRQHYENFTVEFLLDEKNEARRTRVVHVQSGDADTWAGWEAEQLIDFLARHIELPVPQPKLGLQKAEEARRISSQATHPEPVVIEPADSPPAFSAVTQLTQSSTKTVERVPEAAALVNLSGTLHIHGLKVVSIDSDVPIFMLHRGQPYIVQLTLDLGHVVAPSNAPFLCKTTIIFEQLGGPRHSMEQASNIFELSESAVVAMIGMMLPAGIYRLAAFVTLTSDETMPGLTASLTGDLLQVC